MGEDVPRRGDDAASTRVAADSSRAETEPGARLSEEEARTYATFIGVMHDKLVANAHKGGWANDAPHLLLARVCDELRELIDVITPEKKAEGSFAFASRDVAHAAQALREWGPFLKCGGKPAKVAAEAADVANMVMMVADTLGALRTAKAIPKGGQRT